MTARFFSIKKSIKPTRKKFNFRKSESDVKNVLKNQKITKICYFPLDKQRGGYNEIINFWGEVFFPALRCKANALFGQNKKNAVKLKLTAKFGVNYEKITRSINFSFCYGRKCIRTRNLQP